MAELSIIEGALLTILLFLVVIIIAEVIEMIFHRFSSDSPSDDLAGIPHQEPPVSLPNLEAGIVIEDYTINISYEDHEGYWRYEIYNLAGRKEGGGIGFKTEEKAIRSAKARINYKVESDART